jgi:hypothetical protein
MDFCHTSQPRLGSAAERSSGSLLLVVQAFTGFVQILLATLPFGFSRQDCSKRPNLTHHKVEESTHTGNALHIRMHEQVEMSQKFGNIINNANKLTFSIT